MRPAARRGRYAWEGPIAFTVGFAAAVEYNGVKGEDEEEDYGVDDKLKVIILLLSALLLVSVVGTYFLYEQSRR